MPRNGSGTYSTPNSFSAQTTIESAKVNANFSDIGSEITNSLPRDGQASMTGQFKAANGTAAMPSLTFGADTDTGFYRSAANTIGVAIGGAARGSIDATGFANAAGDYATHFPSGTVMLFVQTAAPTGWTKSTTHNDKALRVVSGTASSGGSTAFSSVFAARTIATANLPSHAHTFSGTTSTGGDHSHTVTSVGDSQVGSDGNGAQAYQTTRQTSFSGSHNHSFSGTTSSVGSGTAMDFAVKYLDAIVAVKD